MPGIPYARQNLGSYYDLGKNKGNREGDQANPASGLVAGLAQAAGTAIKVAAMFRSMRAPTRPQVPTMFGSTPGGQDVGLQNNSPQVPTNPIRDPRYNPATDPYDEDEYA